MTQGKPKGLQAKPSKSKKNQSSQAPPKKGRRVIAPKKASLVRQAAVRKELTAKIGKSIEEQMVNAASGGKLTIMKPETSSSSEATSTNKKTKKKG